MINSQRWTTDILDRRVNQSLPNRERWCVGKDPSRKADCSFEFPSSASSPRYFSCVVDVVAINPLAKHMAAQSSWRVFLPRNREIVFRRPHTCAQMTFTCWRPLAPLHTVLLRVRLRRSQPFQPNNLRQLLWRLSDAQQLPCVVYDSKPLLMRVSFAVIS